MEGISTLTQKGQVAIPKAIRDYLRLKPFDKIHFFIKDEKIVAEPITSIENMRGFIKTNKILSKKELKKTVQEAVLNKYAHRS